MMSEHAQKCENSRTVFALEMIYYCYFSLG